MRPPRPETPEGIETLGLGWRPRKTHWNGYWIARQDIADRGYPVRSRFLWSTKDQPTLTLEDWQDLSKSCAVLQGEMLNWGKPGIGKFDALAMFDDTVSSLIEIYLKDPDSDYQGLRHQASVTYARQMEALRQKYGSERIVGNKDVPGITFRSFKRWYEEALDHDCDNPVSHAHERMGKVRILFSHGTLANLPGCATASIVLSKMKFEVPKSRTEIITGQQVIALRRGAHEKKKPSIAFAQTLQDCLMCRQKDVIGELIPKSYPGLSDVHMGSDKWVAGFRWEELDSSFTLTHMLSKSMRGKRGLVLRTGKIKVWSLWNYPPVIEELCLMAGVSRAELRRDLFPAAGPMVTADHTPGLPWRYKMFAKEWRKIATFVGIPKNVQNRDTRAGASTDADRKGADIDRKLAAERIRPALGHSNSDTTLIYLREDDEATARIAEIRFGKQTKP